MSPRPYEPRQEFRILNYLTNYQYHSGFHIETRRPQKQNNTLADNSNNPGERGQGPGPRGRKGLDVIEVRKRSQNGIRVLT